MITEEKFCQYLFFIQFQLTLVDSNVNERYIVGIIAKLRSFFPPENGFCLIENWVFADDFGKISGTSPNELYYNLTKTH